MNRLAIIVLALSLAACAVNPVTGDRQLALVSEAQEILIGRDAERQADDLGYRYSLEQGYDVREMVNVFAALQQSAGLAGQNPVPNWQASHPYPAERIQRINKQLASLPPASPPRRIDEDDYLQRVAEIP